MGVQRGVCVELAMRVPSEQQGVEVLRPGAVFIYAAIYFERDKEGL